MKKLRRGIVLSLSILIAAGAFGMELLAQNVDSNSELLTSTDITNQLHEKKVMPLYALLSTLEQHYDVTFLYKNEVVKNTLVNTAKIQIGETAGQQLSQLLDELGLTFSRVDEQTYVILQKSANLSEAATLLQEQVSGQVTAAGTGESLPGVNLVVKGTTTGTSTDSEGQYELGVPSLQDTLVFSYIGYVDQEVPINGRTEIDVALQYEIAALDELVVVGYGSQKKINLTGSVTQVSGQELENRVMTSPIEALQGKVAGMNISATDAGGRPGASKSFNIRGRGSLSGQSNAYVLVDGVQQDLDSVNPNDIEEITVLKDAAAAAIYGASAPFGVVLITTKKGSNTGEMEVSYSVNVGFDAPTNVPDKVNSLDWIKKTNDAAANSGFQQQFSDEVIQRVQQYMQDPENTPGTVPATTQPDRWAHFNGPDAGFQANGNTDLYKEFLKPWSMNQTHNLSLSGGTNSITYYVSGGMFNDKGQMRHGDDFFNRYNLTANAHVNATDWLDFDVNTRFRNGHSDRPMRYGNGGSWFFDIARRYPTIPVRDPNGHFLSRPINLSANGGRSVNDDNMYLGSIKAILNPLEGWEINTDFSARMNTSEWRGHKKQIVEYFVDGKSSYPVDQTVPTAFETSKSQNVYRTIDLYTSYELGAERHYLKGLVGFQSETSHFSSIWVRKTNLVSDLVPSISTATGDLQADENKHDWATKGFFMRLNYNFDEKYLIELNGRYDGSSRFAEGDRWGFFPSISVGYNIAGEPFWDSLRDKINQLKLRASYGSLGNHDVANYLYLPNMGINTRLAWVMGNERPNYVTPANLISNDLTWETINTLNFGLDMEMLQNRLSFTIDWFQRETVDMFGPAETLPAVLGTSPPQQNNANLQTQGFEVSLGWVDHIGQVQYSVGARLSDHQTTVTKYKNDTGFIHDFYSGQKLGEIWGYTTAGLYQSDEEAQNDPDDQSFIFNRWTAGDVNYKDINGDGVVNNGNQTLENHGDLSIIGNNTPRFQYGFDLGFQWKGIDFSMLLQGVAKRDLWLNGIMFWGFSTGVPSRNGTVLEQQMDYWAEDNKDGYFPKPYMNTSQIVKNRQTQTRYLQNGAYLRLKNVQLGYSLPQSFLSKLNIKNMRVYFTGENLAIFSPIFSSFDPEAIGGIDGEGQIYPLAKTLAIGFNVNI